MLPAMPERKDAKIAPPKSAWETALAGQWWFVSGFWLLLTLAVVLAESMEFPYDITHGLRVASTRWLPWVFLTPALSWLTSRFRLEWSSWPKTIGVYLVACAVIVTGLGALAYFAQEPSRNERFPFSRHDDFDRFHGPRGHDRFSPDSNSSHPGNGPRPPGFDSPRMNSLQLMRVALVQFPTFWLVVLALHSLRFYQQAKERERHEAELESSLTSARLQALRMQLNPHFLFNTLNSIASLIHENPKAADDMIGSLSELLRLTLDSTDRQEASLREELHLLDLYLRIEQTRFGDRLKIEKQVETTALDSVVPILILQPLVENAVKHGIESKLGPGLISITAIRSDGSLILQIADNGRGPAKSDKGEIKEGVGLGNTRARLQALYGVRGSMEIRCPENGGCLVEIKIPWRTVSSSDLSGSKT